ncbi:MAG: IS1595 family transposase, partial [Rickettsiales bacterium]|nr:IS1595 family transposase [Rickettsiales bacterium]
NRIESYWAWTKLRLSRFKGIRYERHYIHLKECEWRFNHRHEDIYRLLLKTFRAHPLF